MDYLQLLKIKIKNNNILDFIENFYIKDLLILKTKFKYDQYDIGDNLMHSYYRSCLQEGVQDAICENMNKKKDLIINELNQIVNK
jgi:lysophospholipase L1-like esterase